MIRRPWQIALLLSLFVSAAQAQPNEIRKSLVRITNTSQEPNYRIPWLPGAQGGGSGTGWVVGPDRLMTNAHVVSNAKFLTVEKDGVKFAPILVAKPTDETRNGPYVFPKGPYPHIQAEKGRSEAVRKSPPRCQHWPANYLTRTTMYSTGLKSRKSATNTCPGSGRMRMIISSMLPLSPYTD